MYQFSLVQSLSRVRLCDSMDYSMPGFPVHHQLPEFTQTHVHRDGDAIHLTVSSSVVPFSSCLQSFPASGSFPVNQFFISGGQSIGATAFNEYSGLISSRIDWMDLLAAQGTLKHFLQHHSSKASILQCSAFFMAQLSHLYITT